jgi:tetratricopeptide (TPR) repeat protein
LASLADAEQKAKDALEVAGPKAKFPQATATLALIEVQWADALNDLAFLWTEKGNKAAEAGNDAKKTEADAKVTDFQNQAKTRLKSAFDLAAAAVKADPSPDLELALADYYRASRSGSNMNKELKKASALKADEVKIALIQGMAFGQEEDGAEKALPKLKTALAASPQSARIHFRMAMTYLLAKDTDNAMKEVKETLKVSPQHERAKLAMEILATSAGQ